MNDFFPWSAAPEGDFAVIGDPVAHSLSPKMHKAAYAACGLSYQYRAVHVAPGDVADALARLTELGYLGVNVTVPHKLEALEWATAPEAFAVKAKAANTLDLKGGRAINTDAPGFLETLRGRIEPSAAILMVGAGGSARALAIALVDAGYEVRIYNRTHERALELAKLAGASVAETLDPGGCALILNTTSASLKGADLQIPWSRAQSDALAYDLAYAAEPTPFMKSAMQAGLRAMDGRELLVAQGALSFEWWLGIPAPREAMLEALS